jgi:hypothetical protein
MSNRALFVGINLYACGQNLAGCVKDINNVAQRLLTPGDPRYGFQASEYTKLLDADATTANWKDALQAFASGAKPGDRLYYHDSHHGTTADDCDLPGQFYCAACPYDFDFSLEKMITDQFYHQLFSALPDGVIFNWCSDSCHSEDSDRIITRHPHKPRLMPGSKNRIGQKRSIVLPGALRNVAFLSGCGHDQTSADTTDPDTGQPCGACTWAYLKTLTQLTYTAPWTQISQLTNRILAQQSYTQDSCVDGGRIVRPMLQA